MKKITDIISKPSEAVDAMIAGLRRQSRRKNFEIKMATYGSSVGKICFGCAATCTIQELAHKNLPPESMSLEMLRAEFLGFNTVDLSEFESVINNLRNGYVYHILSYFEVKQELIDEVQHSSFYITLPVLDTHNWKEKLPPYVKFSKYLKSLGL